MADWPVANDATQYERSILSSGSVYGVTVTANASANTKGNWAEMHAALPFECQGFYVQQSSSSAVQQLSDIGIGPNGSEQVLVANWATATVRASGQSIFFPVYIAKGTRVSMRTQASTGGGGSVFNMLFMSAGWGHMPGYSFCETYNANTATSGSTTGNLDPGGTANTKSSYITIGTTTKQIRALNIMLDIRNAAATTANWRCDVAVGATPDILIPDLSLLVETTMDDLTQRAFGPFPVSIPPGTDIKFRAQCSITDATDRILRNIHMYGMG